MKGAELPAQVWWCAFLAAGVSGLVTLMTLPVARSLSRLVSLVASGTRNDTVGVSRFGGLSVVAGVGSGALLALVAGWHSWGRQIPLSVHVALVATTAWVFLLGILDDLWDLSPAQKLAGEFLAGAALVSSGWQFHVVSMPGLGVVELGWGSWPLSLLWLLGVTNAINLLDGLDGLASGVVAIIASSLLILSVVQGNPGTVVLLAAIAAACFAFLKDNWRPAKIYLGDSGSLTLGFLLGAVSLHSSLKAQTAVAILVPLLALGLPVLDMFLVMIYRFAEGEGRPLVARVLRVFRGDRRHLHHLLQPLLRSHRAVLFLLYALALLFCGAALYVAFQGSREAGWVLLAVELVALFVLRRAGLRAFARSQAEKVKSDTWDRWQKLGKI